MFLYKLRYVVSFGLAQMVILTNPKRTINRNLYENTGTDVDNICVFLLSPAKLVNKSKIYLNLRKTDICWGLEFHKSYKCSARSFVSQLRDTTSSDRKF